MTNNTGPATLSMGRWFALLRFCEKKIFAAGMDANLTMIASISSTFT
ncbi:MAG: hypothetical protein IPJ66_20485 [Bacteroidetes bacterium]|nr:hypothetical protein [Bacteroidota bacterium]